MTDRTRSCLPSPTWGLTATTLLLLPWFVLGLEAQSGDGWNGSRALELVEQARGLRQATAIDSAFQAYEADARGYVYFFLDRPDSDERNLVKTDQIALKLFWRAPDETKQRVIGLRDEKKLPTNIRYHLDHLTVVQDDFGDLIRLGDGDEVAAVTHPVARGAERVYDFRLADSLTISLPGPTPDIRVYEVEIRPKDPDASGVIGSIFLQRGSGAIIRMNFTFTPASYVDRNLDYIRISMDNSVWDGRYWLPYRQEVELRRELPVIDFLAGSVIRGRFEIRDYQFNPPLGDHIFSGGPRLVGSSSCSRELPVRNRAVRSTRARRPRDVDGDREHPEARHGGGGTPLRERAQAFAPLRSVHLLDLQVQPGRGFLRRGWGRLYVRCHLETAGQRWIRFRA